MRAHQQQLDDAITWCNTAANNIVSAKDTITKNVTAAQQEIKTIEDTAALTGLDPNGDVRAIVEREYGENVATIDALAVGLGGKPGVPASPVDGPGKPDPEFSQQPGTGTQKRSKASFASATRPGAIATGPLQVVPHALRASARHPAPGLPRGPGKPPNGSSIVGRRRSHHPTSPVAPPPVPGPAGTPSAPTAPSSPVTNLGGGASSSPGLSSPSSPLTSSPSTSSPSGSSKIPPPEAVCRGWRPPRPAARLPARAPNSTTALDAAAPQSAPMAAPPPAPAPPPAAWRTPNHPRRLPGVGPIRWRRWVTGGQAAPAPPVGAGPGAGAPAAPPPMPLGPPPTPPPAVPATPGAASAGPIGPGVAPASPTVPRVPWSPGAGPGVGGRAEREAVAAAATAGALRRQSGGNDPMQLARRIGAALNAGDNIDFGFFWVTAVTMDGTIVVANSYGLGYIPEGVTLPEQVRMASADDSTPAGERAKWATYPTPCGAGLGAAPQRQPRGLWSPPKSVRFDLALRVTPQPQSDTGQLKMQRPSRSEAIAPQAAARLAAVSDAGLAAAAARSGRRRRLRPTRRARCGSKCEAVDEHGTRHRASGGIRHLRRSRSRSWRCIARIQPPRLPRRLVIADWVYG